jgi:anthranilate phosphoribosyltransferase
MIRESISKLIEGKDLTRDEAAGVMNEIMDAVASPAQMAAFLTALRLKGETVDEITGCARVMRDKAIPVKPSRTDIVDIVGTGGDGAKTFNISTTAMFVVAGAGLGVAKHGNRAVSSASGSADVLEALGVNLDLTPDQVADCIDEVGAGFLFALKLHPAMKNVAPVRKDLGIRTVFNILGPLTNPARTPAQVVGVYDSRLLKAMAEVLRELGGKAAYVFQSSDGIDELTTTGINRIARFDNGVVHEEELDARSLGMRAATRDELRGGTPQDNAKITREVLSGSDRGPMRDVVVLNAAAALVVGGKERDLKAGVARANDAIDSGKGEQVLHGLVAKSQGYQKRNG